MFSSLSLLTVADDRSKQRYIKNEKLSDRKTWFPGCFFFNKDIIIVKKLKKYMINRLWYGILYINPRPILALGPLVLWLIWAPRVDMTWYEKCHIIIINIFNLVTRIQLLKGNKIYYHIIILCEIVLIVFKYPVGFTTTCMCNQCILPLKLRQFPPPITLTATILQNLFGRWH
jgi:hypothetical protein